jgi:hypothetical protein
MSHFVNRTRHPRARSLTNPAPLRTINVPQGDDVSNAVRSPSQSLRSPKKKQTPRKNPFAPDAVQSESPTGITAQSLCSNSSSTGGTSVRHAHNRAKQSAINISQPSSFCSIAGSSPTRLLQFRARAMAMPSMSSRSSPSLPLYNATRSRLMSPRLAPLMTPTTITAETHRQPEITSPSFPLEITDSLSPLYAALRARRRMPLPRNSRLKSPGPTVHVLRAPPQSQAPPVHMISTPLHHTLSVHIPKPIGHDMVTVYAKKGDRIGIVADAWHVEADCESRSCFGSSG